MNNRLSVWLTIYISIILIFVPVSAFWDDDTEERQIVFKREFQPQEQIVIFNSMEMNETFPRIKLRDPRFSPFPNRPMPSTNVAPFGLSTRPPILNETGERTIRIFHAQPRDPFLPISISIFRLKVRLNPSLYPPLSIYQVNTIPTQHDVVEEPEWRFVNGDQTEYSSLSIPEEKERIWVDLLYEEGPLVLTVYSPDAVLGPFEDADDGIFDNRVYLEIAGDTIMPEGEWYFRIENTGDEESRYTFTIWY
ncbi:hypothetical protein FTO68_07450 [Methanocalculus taiwanensis]|uniref:Uncharacterized protein n=1 Tax=Methanocalculus taiwanensis TaxID=106207 RepID=A0ABD4TIQ6_9EURY|nr:hypothetical protein [Methanocalculus taiwanensis]MCQ1538819.1 hypothetical protein [Methanocalculus taiwanensis]